MTFFSLEIWLYYILGPESSCLIFFLAYTLLYIYIYVFYAFDIREKILDIEKNCQIFNIAHVQNSVNKYYMGNDIFMLHFLIYWLIYIYIYIIIIFLANPTLGWRIIVFLITLFWVNTFWCGVFWVPYQNSPLSLIALV